jgi:hypothetical protein
MNIRFTIKGVDKTISYLLDIGGNVPHVAINAIAEYLKIKLMIPAPYKYASRARAYGNTGATFANGNPVPDGYFSAKQFRYVMSRIADGTITPGTENRTGASSRAWVYLPIKAGQTTGYIMNKSAGAYYTMSDEGQARQPANVGWLKSSQVIAANIKGALATAIVAVRAYLKSK